MYKVFVNDRPIIFTSSLIFEEDFPLLNFKDISIPHVINKVKAGNLKGVYLFSEELEKDWELFCRTYNIKEAGGGLVLNDKKEILFIYRARKWDLPKGRKANNETIEETAIREVQEECGISQVTIDQFLLNTYHMFYDKGALRLKKIYWFLMKTSFTGELTPLLEEGIKHVVFKNQEEIEAALQNTYANVRTVYQTYQTLAS